MVVRTNCVACGEMKCTCRKCRRYALCHSCDVEMQRFVDRHGQIDAMDALSLEMVTGLTGLVATLVDDSVMDEDTG